MLQRRSLHIATREPAIVVTVSGQHPSLVALAADISLTSLTLGCERIEFLFEPFLGRFAGVDRTAPMARISPRHCGLLSAGQREPTRARASEETSGLT